MNTLPNEAKFILEVALSAGAISIAISTFVLNDRTRNLVSKYVLFFGLVSSFFLFTSSFLTSIQYFFENSIYTYVSSIFLLTGVITLLIPTLYMTYKLIKFRVEINAE